MNNQVLKQATLYFSRSTPNLAMVIPAMDHIDHELASSSWNRAYLPSIHAATSLVKKTCNQYYSYTDKSEMYHITMGEQNFILLSINANIVNYYKCSTQGTNYLTSRMHNGKTNGLQPLKCSSERSLRVHMPCSPLAVATMISRSSQQRRARKTM